jgi:hypothetical protein
MVYVGIKQPKNKFKNMETIKIKSKDCEYTFTQHENENKIFYNFYENDKLLYQAIDTGNDIDLNGKLFSYHDFAEMYLFFRAIKKTDTKLMGDYIATTETNLFDL